MNSIWNRNIQAFKNRFPSLTLIYHRFVNKSDFHFNFWEISTAKDGNPTASENNFRLHSAYNPVREANGAINRSEVLEKSTIVFYGFGIGYHVVELAKAAPEKKIVLIEPDPERFFAALTLIDWTPVFAVENLIIAISCPTESVLPLIESHNTVNIGNTGVSDAYYFSIPTFTAHAQNYFDAVKQLIQRNIKKNDINAATLKRFGKLWVKNSLRNLSKMKELDSILDFEGTLKEKNIPFLIVGAGPSLEQTLPLMSQLKKRMVIVCVETALRSLLKNNVQPDFIILTDPQYWAYKHIAGYSASDSILITEICTWSAVFRFNCREIRLCSSQLPVGQYFESKIRQLGNLGAGGSVASSAWNFAYFCGARQIYTTGLDFAFPGKQTHITGSESEQKLHCISNRISGVENATASTIYNSNAVYAQDFNGNKVLTDSRMKMFAWWFESRLANCKDAKTFTLSPRGLNIPGMQICSIKKLLSLPEITEQKKQFLNPEKKLTASQKTSFDKSFDELIKDFPNQEFFNQFGFLREYF